MDKIQRRHSFRLRNYARNNHIAFLILASAAIFFCIVLSVVPSFYDKLSLFHSAKPYSKAASSLGASSLIRHSNIAYFRTNGPLAASSIIRRINVPYFHTNVPFDQTAIFWFGTIDSTNNYTDVRIGYNSSELYIDLRVIDRYLWYDPNTQAPDLTKGDNASIYLNTTKNGSNTLDQHSYQLQTGVNGNIQRNNYQKAYIGNGTAWTQASTRFTTSYWWRGHGFNGPEGSGWSMTYHIPFSSLGMSTPPPQGTLWKLAIKVHDRDNASYTPISDKWWPEFSRETIPSSWGDLVFGLPIYQPPRTGQYSAYVIRNKLNNQVITDGMVGGALGCGNLGLDRWNQIGKRSYPGANRVNIQNEQDMSDWNCFSKFYVTFPLSSLPKGKAVFNATVTLYEYGNAGAQGRPNPSYIQIATINENWNAATLAWNTAPLIKENLNSILVPTKSKPVIAWPGLAITWDVSVAVADAYASGQPLRLVFYSTDSAYDTGKYFTSSYVGDWDAAGRPTLRVNLLT